MNTRMDAEPNDDPEREESAAADSPTDADASGDDESDDSAHLGSLPDGAGCAEVWEHLSENRDDE